MRVLVTGGHGMLGQDLVPLLEQAGHEVLAPTHAEVALEDKGALEAWLGGRKPARVYHLAAYTDVDGCELDPARARRSNTTASENLAALAFKWDAEVLALGTDYVFDGSARAPIPVDALPAPLNVYGRTKHEGEEAIRRVVARHWIVRVSWLCGPHGRNFVAAIRARIAAGQRRRSCACPTSRPRARTTSRTRASARGTSSRPRSLGSPASPCRCAARRPWN